ncbi:MAG: DUF4338 domain-containing protein [Opitutus sp.]|nr:DUF4338 domain-containing protein [Opitutus sp.]MCS6277689.1 DUF4338 domain-containing protein [Opitutus sp.]
MQVLDSPELNARAQGLLEEHHYLGAVRPVGERLLYAVSDAQGTWVAVLVFAAAALHLRGREAWIGWSGEQRRRRLALVVNNVRFLLLPKPAVSHLGSAVLSRVLGRLSADWQARYQHPVLVVETFVDPERFTGSVYKASGWTELGQTKGNTRKSRDYYEHHAKPKRLFVRELEPRARRALQAGQIKPSLAAVEAKVPVRSTLKVPDLISLAEAFRQVPEYRAYIGAYPLHALLAITAAAYLAGAPRGQRDLAAFARRLSSSQRQALGVIRRRGKYGAPSQPTFSRLFARVQAARIEEVLLAHQRQVRGEPPRQRDRGHRRQSPQAQRRTKRRDRSDLAEPVLSGQRGHRRKKQRDPRRPRPVREADLVDKLVRLDALHTQADTARAIVLEHGGDYLFTVKGNQPGLQKIVAAQVPDPGAPFWTR